MNKVFAFQPGQHLCGQQKLGAVGEIHQPILFVSPSITRADR